MSVGTVDVLSAAFPHWGDGGPDQARKFVSRLIEKHGKIRLLRVDGVGEEIFDELVAWCGAISGPDDSGMPWPHPYVLEALCEEIPGFWEMDALRRKDKALALLERDHLVWEGFVRREVVDFVLGFDLFRDGFDRGRLSGSLSLALDDTAAGRSAKRAILASLWEKGGFMDICARVARTSGDRELARILGEVRRVERGFLACLLEERMGSADRDRLLESLIPACLAAL